MKYWFFNGSDVVGPFTPRELSAEKAFNENSLVCPEQFSDEQDHWQPALSFADFQPWLTPSSPAQDQTLEQEMNTLLQETSPLSFEKTNTDDAGLQLPKKPAKPGPIEEYFKHIKKENLGDILGIPDPAEDSDMDLAHSLKNQLETTSSTRRKERELTEADDKTVSQLEAEPELPEAQQTHHVATATEVFATQAPVATAVLEPDEPKTDLPILPTDSFQGMPTADTAPVLPSVPVSAQPSPLTENPVQNAEPKTSPFPQDTAPRQDEPAAQDAAQPTEQESAPAYATAEEQASLRAEYMESNSINARLKQTQEMKDFLREQTKHSTDSNRRLRNSFIALFAICVILGTIFVLHQMQARSATVAPQEPATAVSTAQQLLSEAPSTPSAPPQEPAPAAQPTDPRQQALNIVQNHLLSNKRGTLSNYLNTIYQTQLSQGYTGTWEAQPLHKNTYLVKYQLTKTRKEPIIYVFQADVAKGKLTGALNNISLDLVGKI